VNKHRRDEPSSTMQLDGGSKLDWTAMTTYQPNVYKHIQTHLVLFTSSALWE